MNSYRLIGALVASGFLPSCTTTPTAPSAQQILVANAVEDALSVGLVPVLANNPAIVPEVAAAAKLLRAATAATFTPADVDGLVARLKLSPADARLVAGLLNAAWSTYQRRYAEQVGQVRPDVALFTRAVANGIERAVAAVPK
jgi:hypothetical protein